VAAHFWIATIGILLYVLSIYVAGITQGLMWRAFDETGQPPVPRLRRDRDALMPFYWIRVARRHALPGGGSCARSTSS
jgi:cytochrome c oxidase cbb3-type subunit I/II